MNDAATGSALLTPEEVAHRLKLQPDTVREYLRAGKIKGIHLARKWRIREEALDAFIRGLEEQPG